MSRCKKVRSLMYCAVFLLLPSLPLLKLDLSAFVLEPPKIEERTGNSSISSSELVMSQEMQQPPMRNVTIDEKAPIIDVQNASLDESFSACLLVMDENFRLPEWLAYHYHALPLRYLVVAVDPRSQLSPEPIFAQFRQELNMTIVSWNDAEFLQGQPKLRRNAPMRRKRAQYLIRQRQFLGRCLAHLHDHNRTWTALWDTDEYITYNGFNISRTNPENQKTALAPIDMSEPGTILRYLKDYGEQKCTPMSRVLVGNRETPGLMNETTHPFDPRRFDTLRFRYRGKMGTKIQGIGKSMVNVARIQKFPIAVPNPHRPVVELCPEAYRYVPNSPFYLNHFIGSWEAYSFRDDSRRGSERSYEAYLERATTQNRYYENKISQWMPSFMKEVGEERGRILLSSAGLDPDYNASSKIDAWKMIK